MAKITVNINGVEIKKLDEGFIPITTNMIQELKDISLLMNSGVTGFSLINYPSLWNYLKVKNDNQNIHYSWIIFREKGAFLYNGFEAPLDNHLLFNKQQEAQYGKICLIADYKRFAYEVFTDGALTDKVFNAGALANENILIAKNDGCLDGGRYMKSVTLPWEKNGGASIGGLYASIGEKYIVFYSRKESDRIYANNKLVFNNDPNSGMTFNVCELSSGSSIGNKITYSDNIYSKIGKNDGKTIELDNFQCYILDKITEVRYLDFYGNQIDKKVSGQDSMYDKPSILPVPENLNNSEIIVETGINTAVATTKNQITNTIKTLSEGEVKQQVDIINSYGNDLKEVPSLYNDSYKTASEKDDTSVMDALETIAFILPLVGGIDSQISGLMSMFTAGGEVDKLKDSVKELDKIGEIKGTFAKGVFLSSRLIRIGKSLYKLIMIPITIVKIIGMIAELPSAINQITSNPVLSQLPQMQQVVQIFNKGATVQAAVPLPTKEVEVVNIDQVKQVHPYEPELTIFNGNQNVLQEKNFPVKIIIKDNFNEDPQFQGLEVPVKKETGFNFYLVTGLNLDNVGQETLLFPTALLLGQSRKTVNIKLTNPIGNNYKIRLKRAGGDYIYNKDSEYFNIIDPIKLDISVPNIVLKNENVSVNFKAKLNI